MPFELDLVLGGDIGVGFAFLTGVEAVPVTHQDKSGLFLNVLFGLELFWPYSYSAYYGLKPKAVTFYGGIVNANIGYQLITKGGFVLNATAGAIYNSLAKQVTPRFMLNIGFAF